MPSHTAGKPMPGFLGGSDLAVPIGANKALARRLDQAYTSTPSMTALRGIGNIPNTTSLLGSSVTRRRQQQSWFVPTAKNWVNVENGNILRNMLAQILTGKLSIKQAAQSASDNITSVLNALGTRCADAISLTSSRSPTERRSPPRPRSWPRRRPLRGSGRSAPRGPYWLLLPVLVAIAAILGYPLYKLVVLSFQQYGLAELIQHKGVWVGLDELQRPSSTTRSSGTRCCARSCSRPSNVGLTIGIGTLLALLLVASARSSASCSPPASCSSGRCRSSSPSRSGTG